MLSSMKLQQAHDTEVCMVLLLDSMLFPHRPTAPGLAFEQQAQHVLCQVTKRSHLTDPGLQGLLVHSLRATAD